MKGESYDFHQITRSKHQFPNNAKYQNYLMLEIWNFQHQVLQFIAEVNTIRR
jgi:regulatory protein YycI of two-component signal transduction system YycFG